MKTNVAQTSIQCYKEIEYEGVISKQQRIILDRMDWNLNYSLQEIVKLTEFPINVISGRVNELKDKGLITHSNKRKCHITKRTIQSVQLRQYPKGLF